MKRFQRFKICRGGFLILLLLMASCVDNQYSIKNIDTTIKLDKTIVAPLARTHVTLEEFMPTTLEGMEIKVEGDNYYLAVADTQYMGNELINNAKIVPAGTFHIERYLISFLDHISSGKGVLSSSASLRVEEGYTHYFSMTEDYLFDGLNTNPNERLDSILFDDSPLTVTVSCNVPLLPGSYIDIQPRQEEFKLDETIYPNNTIRIPLESLNNVKVVNLLKTKMYLNGGATLEFLISGCLITNNPLSVNDKLIIDVNFDEMLPYISYLNIGNARDMYEGDKEIDFDYTKDFQIEDAFFPFYDPIINMLCESNIGVPARYYIDYVEAYDSKTGESVRADFGGANPDTTSIFIQGPTYDQIEGMSPDELYHLDLKSLIQGTNVVFDRNFGHTERLFQINADKLRYHYRIRSVETDRTKVQFLFQKSDMNLIEDTHLGLWFEGNPTDSTKNMYLMARDTVAISMDPLDTGEVSITPETKANLQISTKSFLPAGARCTMYMLNAEKKPILTELQQDFQIKSAKNNEQGRPIEVVETEKAASASMTYTQLQDFISQVKYLVFNYKVRNENNETLQLTTKDWLEAKAKIYIDGAVIFDPANLNNGGTNNAQ